jgi:hypothetical protein
MTGCSVIKSWLNAETWMDDRLRPCKHISLVSQSHIFIAGISTRVGKQHQHIPTCCLGSKFLFFAMQLHKSQCLTNQYHQFSSVVECALECNALSPNSERSTFYWNGLCVHNCFKYSETKWSQLPSLLSKALETGPTVYKSGTLVESTLLVFFANLQLFQVQPGHWLSSGSHVIILY